MPDQILERIQNTAEALSDNTSEWNKKFLESIEQTLRKYGDLSYAQMKTFEKIEETTAPAYLALEEKHKRDYLTELRPRAMIMAKFYFETNKLNQTGYWGALISRIFEEEDYVVPRRTYKQFVHSKYAEGYYIAYTEKPKFADGALVTLKKHLKDIAEWKAALVVASNHQVPTSHAMGAKKYLLMPVGGTCAVTVEERDIKKYKL